MLLSTSDWLRYYYNEVPGIFFTEVLAYEVYCCVVVVVVVVVGVGVGVVVGVVVVVLTSTRTMKSVVTGQAPVTLEWRNIIPQGTKKTQSKPTVVVHAYLVPGIS